MWISCHTRYTTNERGKFNDICDINIMICDIDKYYLINLIRSNLINYSSFIIISFFI